MRILLARDLEHTYVSPRDIVVLDSVPNDISPVAELPYACTIVQLIERREWKPVSYADAKESLHMELFNTKLRDEYGVWVEELRDRTFIERRGYFADAASFNKASADASTFEQGLEGYDVLGGGSGASSTP